MSRIVLAVSSVLGVLATVATLIMMVAISIDVAYRWFFGSSVPGILEGSETALVAAVFLGMAYTGATNGHIAVDLLTERLSSRASRYLIAFGWIATTAILIWMLYATSHRAIAATESREVRMGLLNWPLWPARWLIVVGLAAMLLIAVTNVVRILRGKEVLGFRELATIGTDTRSVQVATQERASLSSLAASNEPVVVDHDDATGKGPDNG